MGSTYLLDTTGVIVDPASPAVTVGAAVPTKATYIAGSDGTNVKALLVDNTGKAQINVASSVLPTGAATETTLANVLGSVDNLESYAITTNSLLSTVITNTGNIDANSDTLEALIGTTNSTLTSIDAGIPSALGQGTMAASMSVAIASNQTAVPVSMLDVAPATQNITALDVSTATAVGANSQSFYLGTPTANSAASFTISSMNTASVETTTGSIFTGTLVVEVSMDSGSTWIRPNIVQPGTQFNTNGFTSVFYGVVNVTDCTNIRVRSITSWTGTAVILLRTSSNVNHVSLGNSIPVGANVIGGVTQSGNWSTRTQDGSGNAITSQVSGAQRAIDVGINVSGVQVDPRAIRALTSADVVTANAGTNLNTSALALESGGNLAAIAASASVLDDWDETDRAKVNPIVGQAGVQGGAGAVSANTQRVVIATDQTALPISGSVGVTEKLTYGIGIANIVIAAATTDAVVVQGSATKTIEIKRIILSASGAAGANPTISLIKRSAANTGGTSTTPTFTPFDSTSAAATAVCRVYTANPAALGAAVGTLDARKIFATGVTTTPATTEIFDYELVGTEPITIRGTSEFLAINFGGATITTPSVCVTITITEA